MIPSVDNIRKTSVFVLLMIHAHVYAYAAFVLTSVMLMLILMLMRKRKAAFQKCSFIAKDHYHFVSLRRLSCRERLKNASSIGKI